MSYNYPPPGQGYPPQQPGYPPNQQAYPGSGYPSSQPAYQSAAAPGAYQQATGGYPPAPGGGYPPVPGGGYPPASSGGYSPVSGAGYHSPTGGIGFEGIASQPSGPVQNPAQSYNQPPYGGIPPAPQYGASPSGGGYPPQPPYGTPQGQGYPAPAAAPVPSQAQLYGQPPYGQSLAQPPYGQAPAQPPYGQAPAQPGQYQAKPGKSADKLAHGMAAMSIATHGTVVAARNFNAESDAQALRKAMKGLGTDEKAIIAVIGHRTNAQRQKIKTTYKQAYGRDLVKDLKSELSGRFEDLAVALMMKPREYDAYCLKDAMEGAGTTESTLIEILVSRSNEEIKEINEIYKKTYGRALEKSLMNETSGHFRKLLVSLNNASRDTSTHVDQAKARDDAQRLYSAGEKKWGTDEATFNLVMASRSHPQLRATFDAYQQVANRDITRSIKGEFSGDIEDGMLALIEVVRNPPAYFASRLYHSMKGAGTNDKALIRAVVTRCEIDMVEIKQQFYAMFKKDLPGYIKDDTSGDYRNLLLALVAH